MLDTRRVAFDFIDIVNLSYRFRRVLPIGPITPLSITSDSAGSGRIIRDIG